MTTPSVLTKMPSNQPVRQAHQNANLEHDYQNDLRRDLQTYQSIRPDRATC
jgi:hypothetical protein